MHLTAEQAISTFAQYDLVLDCTDHPTSRYLISDACVLTGKPLVSASALKTEGQLSVLNNPPRAPGDPSGGPCYRCVFPKPPPAESIQSCGEGGILGPVVGLMGVLQALEAIKVLTAKPPASKVPEWVMQLGLHSTTPAPEEPVRQTLLMFSAYSNPQFRSVRLRSRRVDCAVCSAQATISHQSLTCGSLDYVAFCGVNAPNNVLSPEEQVTASEFSHLPRDGSNILIDVRDDTQYSICALRGSINIPWTGNAESWVQQAMESGAVPGYDDGRTRYVICRLGNDSQLAVKAVVERGGGRIRDIRGGFKAWRAEVDSSWPSY
jgi:adenylyltransferase and sulfurtransferase